MSGGPAAQGYSASCIWRTDAQKAASSAPGPIEAPDQTAHAGYRAPWEEHTQREPKLELGLGGLPGPARSPWGRICPQLPALSVSSLSIPESRETELALLSKRLSDVCQHVGGCCFRLS